MAYELVHELMNPFPEGPDNFGTDVAISGDGGTVVVGNIGDDIVDHPGVGSASIFDAKTGELQHYIPNPYPNYSDWFGDAVDVSEDGERIIIGAPLNDSRDGISNQGAVYVYNNDAELGPVDIRLCFSGAIWFTLPWIGRFGWTRVGLS